MAPRLKITPRKRTAAALAVVVAGLAFTGAGVYAGLTAVATGTESVQSGVLSLTLAGDGTSAGFPQTLTDVAPGDVYNTFVDLTNGSSSDLAGQNITLAVAGSPSGSTLITPPSADGSTGLEVSIIQCSVAWTVSDANCSGTPTTLLSNTAVSGLGTAASLISGSIPAGSSYHLEVSLTEPSSLSETDTNGTLNASTIEGQPVALTYTFSESQRTATTTNA